MSGAVSAGAQGRGFFRAGAIGMIVVGLMHASSHLKSPPAGSEAVIAAMQGFTSSALGMTWSVLDAYEAVSLSYSVMSIWLGISGLAVLSWFRPEARPLRGLAALFSGGTLLLVVISAAYRVAPPLHFYALVAALFAVGALRAR